MKEFRTPTIKNRTAIVGRTGSGKTTFGAWVLSVSPIDVIPWIVLDYKGDELLKQIPYAHEIRVGELPKAPGLYHAFPRPEADDELVKAWLLKIWERRKIGLFIDESYMVPQCQGLTGLLTQGRALRCPVIALSQRPVRVPRFIFSEADFITVFQLNHAGDRKTVAEYVSEGGAEFANRLPDFNAYWYDVAQNAMFQINPVDKDIIFENFESKLKPKRRFF